MFARRSRELRQRIALTETIDFMYRYKRFFRNSKSRYLVAFTKRRLFGDEESQFRVVPVGGISRNKNISDRFRTSTPNVFILNFFFSFGSCYSYRVLSSDPISVSVLLW